MSSIAHSARSARAWRPSVAARIGDEGLLIIVLALFAAALGAAAPYLLVPDSWLTLVGGREISDRGLPQLDSLSVLAHGRHWVDQQWLAQLATYRLAAALGIGATLAIFTALLGVTLVVACLIARRSASPRSVAIFVLLAFPSLFGSLRAQTFSFVLFVPFFALLCRESRRPSRKVWVALPMLALWANLHGAVLVAAALLALLGITEAAAGRRARGAGLVLGSAASIFATPHGLGIVGYYHATAGNPLFRTLIPEWAPPTPFSYVGLPFFVTAVVAVVLVARHRRVLSLFETAALSLTLAGALAAERSVLWFAFAALLLLPVLLDRAWPARWMRARTRTFVSGFALCTVGLAAALVVHSFVVGGRLTDAAYPPAAVKVVGAALAADPRARVLADDETSDWLLYKLPQLRGRLAFDDRWEVLSPQAFRAARDYLKQAGPAPDRLAAGYQIFVVDRTWRPALARKLASMRGLRVLYRGSRVAVYER